MFPYGEQHFSEKHQSRYANTLGRILTTVASINSIEKRVWALKNPGRRQAEKRSPSPSSRSLSTWTLQVALQCRRWWICGHPRGRVPGHGAVGGATHAAWRENCGSSFVGVTHKWFYSVSSRCESALVPPKFSITLLFSVCVWVCTCVTGVRWPPHVQAVIFLYTL